MVTVGRRAVNVGLGLAIAAPGSRNAVLHFRSTGQSVDADAPSTTICRLHGGETWPRHHETYLVSTPGREVPGVPIRADGLTRTFGAITLEVPQGVIFGFLGSMVRDSTLATSTRERGVTPTAAHGDV